MVLVAPVSDRWRTRAGACGLKTFENRVVLTLRRDLKDMCNLEARATSDALSLKFSRRLQLISPSLTLPARCFSSSHTNPKAPTSPKRKRRVRPEAQTRRRVRSAVFYGAFVCRSARTPKGPRRTANPMCSYAPALNNLASTRVLAPAAKRENRSLSRIRFAADAQENVSANVDPTCTRQR